MLDDCLSPSRWLSMAKELGMAIDLDILGEPSSGGPRRPPLPGRAVHPSVRHSLTNSDDASALEAARDATLRFLARPFVERGSMFVIPKYGLCPDHNMDELVAQCRRAVAWTHRHASEHGGDSARLFISGHSAGGHITGMMLATDWAATDGLPENAIKGVTGISGLYDLEPIRLSKVNEPLRLLEASADRNSPVKLPLPIKPPATLLAFGGLESDEYGRQGAAYRDVLRKAGGEPVTLKVEGHHHFSILDAFGNPKHRLGRAVLEQLGLA